MDQTDLSEHAVAPSGSLGNRGENVSRLASESFDVLIIGGGITGAGIALDAASRGMKVGLVEREDFAAGTSSRSSKLIHGGLRYVAQYQFKVTREASEERYKLQRLAPHLVKPVPFLLPVYGGIKETAKLAAGLWLYDVLATLRNTHLHRRLSVHEVHEFVPTLTMDGLDGGFVYFDCRTDDARLTVEVLKAAVRYGAVIANHVSADGFEKVRGRIAGALATDHLSKTSFHVHARCVVAAAGVWIDKLRPKADEEVTPLTRPAKGVHLVFAESRIGNRDVALTLQTARDHRITFVIPWMGRTLVGTTDDDYAGELDQPKASSNDTEYLMEAVMKAFPDQKLTPDDIITVQAGLRPLVNDQKDTSAGVSREDRLIESDSGLISIAGGKLTTYRRMAKKVVDLVAKRLADQRIASGVCRTGSIPIGASTAGPMPLLARQPADVQANLIHLYGGNAENICALVERRPSLAKKLAPDLPHIAAQIVFAAQDEMAVSLGDALIRRMRFAPTDRTLGLGTLGDAADLLAQELDWSPEERAAHIARYRQEIVQFAVPGRALPEPHSST